MNKQPKIKLDDFEGPLDLLLNLLKKNQLTITDVSLVAITDQYMTYIKEAQTVNLPLVGEYYVLATTLMEMKSRALLPAAVPEEDELVSEEDLLNRLKEYERYQLVTKQFKLGEQEARSCYTIAPLRVPRSQPKLLQPAKQTKTDLKASYVYLLNKNVKTAQVQQVQTNWRYSLATQTGLIRQRLVASGNFYFKSLLQREDRQEIVTNFLAVLNMTKHGELKISQKSGADILIVTGEK